MSMRRTRVPLRASPAASEIEVLVLPVPPFCDAMEMTLVIGVQLAGIPLGYSSLLGNHSL